MRAAGRPVTQSSTLARSRLCSCSFTSPVLAPRLESSTRGMESSTFYLGGSAYSVLPSSCLGLVVHITSPSRLPSLAPGLERLISIGRRTVSFSFFLLPSLRGTRHVARRRSSWHDSSVPLPSQRVRVLSCEGSVVPPDLGPRGELLVGHEDSNGSSTTSQRSSSRGVGMLSMGA